MSNLTFWKKEHSTVVFNYDLQREYEEYFAKCRRNEVEMIPDQAHTKRYIYSLVQFKRIVLLVENKREIDEKFAVVYVQTCIKKIY